MVKELKEIRNISEIAGMNFSIWDYYLKGEGKPRGMKGIGRRYIEREQYNSAYKDWLPASDDNIPPSWKVKAKVDNPRVLRSLDAITVTPD